ncbi:XkdN-like protein [Paenibacillus sp. L3-i20]|uniref:phage tail assembly chaperone n=1 Tax=Paenibacillus sp. L3-i20 TaxID=2905833 RepID=UPI001EE00C0E|nr:XkdN-like protein [Paenibacillus sp. L3-i20]GKU79856.1 hypothetical protein L3i20_v242530 [Paenibacillus sp. L3-i20]
MSSLQEFLNNNPIDNITKEVPISERLKDDKGNLLLFKIKGMTGDEFEDLRKKSTKTDLRKGKRSVAFDNKTFNEQMVINHTIEPDFKSAASIEALKCTSPSQYLNKVLLAGEIIELSNQIQTLSGFELDLSELVEEAKN